MTDGLLLANALSTWFMVGVIWLIQLALDSAMRYSSIKRGWAAW